jgi:hypothetical protein
MIQNTLNVTLKLIEIRVLLILLLGFDNGIPGFSQSNSPENIHVDFDKTFYLSGEFIHFKIYFLNQGPLRSKIVHVDLRDANGNYVMTHIYRVNNKTAHGSYRVPYDLKEGNYLFRCYTRWNLNFSKKPAFSQLIPVFNEFEGVKDLNFLEDSVFWSNDSLQKKYNYSDGILITIGNDGPIHPNQNVRIELITLDDNNQPIQSNLSLSVVPLTQINNSNPHKENRDIISAIPGDSIIYTPEESFEINGLAFDPETGEPINSRVLSVFNVRDATFTRLISKKGSFKFKLPLFEGNVDLQIINMNPFQPNVPEIRWIRLQEEIGDDLPFNPVPERTKEVERYIYHTKLRRKIHEIFYETTYDSIELQKPPVLPFEPDRSYNMDDYQLIRNTFDFFKQAIVNTNFYKENGEEKMRLFNLETKEFFMTSPWYVVDGHFIFNDSLVHNIPFNHLSRIDIYNRNESVFRYFEPIMIQGGVVAIYTKNNFLIDYIRTMPNTLRVEGLPRSIPEENKVKNEDLNSHETPDFSPLIHWDPEIQTDEEGKSTITFRTNDVTGDIAICIEGIDRNGNIVSGQKVFRVSNE